ncbi:hypothetical protein EDD15DRAFT_958170 [Pisolithus albus]|nr:hypothetical protein EDD15DRAFT_958170 [Pisolithus albus]
MGNGPCHRFSNRRKKDRDVKFFSDVFGLQYLRNYIGEITFFARFPWMMDMDPPEDGLLARSPILSSANWVMKYNLPRGSQQSDAAQLDARHKALLPLWQRLCQTPLPGYRAPHWLLEEKRRPECELKSISQTLGAELSKYIMTTFSNVIFERRIGGAARPAANIDYDRHLNIPSAVQEIEALRVKLDATEDEDEQRALDEDVTGKILWLCWCGICAEVDELLPKVVDYFRQNNIEQGLRHMKSIMMPEMHPCEPSDDQAHLRRIMLDAGAGISKHQLLLAARAAEQAKWSGANKAVVAKDYQGTTSSTSSQAPSEPVV